MTSLSRRTFLKQVPAVTAFAAIPVAAVAAEPLQIETQEEKCARLLWEFLAELRKIPRPHDSSYGPYVDVVLGPNDERLRYSTRKNGHGELLFLSL